MPDEMGKFQSFQDIHPITKVETETFQVLDQRKYNGDSSSSRLPPGFRFHPTDEELVSYYLTRKVENNNYNSEAIDEVNLNRCEPWDLPAKAKVGENAFYFFSLRDRKYPTGMRTNRATEAGYWKATGKDREVMSSDSNKLVGMKKTLVFYLGRAPKGEKTNWIMHEYRIEGASSPATEWVVCRVFKKTAAAAAGKKSAAEGHGASSHSYQQELEDNDTSSYEHQSSTYLPPLTDSPNHQQSTSQVLTSQYASAYNNPSSSSAVEYHHQHQQLQAAGINLSATAADVYLNAARATSTHEHELPQLRNSRTFSMSDLNNFNNTNWAIRREIQGVVNTETVETLVSGLLHWDSVGPMPSSNDVSVWPNWNSASD